MEPKRVRTKANAKANPQPVDRISKLPDPIIHRILSLVPTIDVVRMSLLSKHWRRMWYSVPAVNFSHADRTKYFLSSGEDGFYNCINECLKHRKAASRYICDSVVTRFRFHMECPRGRAALDECLAFAIGSKVAEELDIRVREDMKYRLPESVLNMRSLSVLKLKNLVLDGSYSEITLPALKHLSLIVVYLSDEVLRDLISGCPSLDNFFLEYTDDSGSLRPSISITSSTLKFLKIIIWDMDIEQVHVEAKNLVSFKYNGHCKHLDISACTAIRNLSLRHCSIGKQSLENLIFGLPVLENFTLGNFDSENHITFRGQNLKSVKLENSDSDCDSDDV